MYEIWFSWKLINCVTEQNRIKVYLKMQIKHLMYIELLNGTTCRIDRF